MSKSVDAARVYILPYPPSVNRLYRVFRGRAIMSKEGRLYYEAAIHACAGWPRWKQRVDVMFFLCPPDRRARDGDNTLKCLFDVLRKAGVIPDDNSNGEVDQYISDLKGRRWWV